VRLFPDFDARLAPDVAWVWETRGAAPLVVTGDILADVRRLVSTRPPGSSDISESAIRRVRE
jgi:hypothetical protein